MDLRSRASSCPAFKGSYFLPRDGLCLCPGLVLHGCGRRGVLIVIPVVVPRPPSQVPFGLVDELRMADGKIPKKEILSHFEQHFECSTQVRSIAFCTSGTRKM